MDDSALFMQWAMDMLEDDEHPVAPVANDCDDETTFPSLQALRDVSSSNALLVVDPELITAGGCCDFSPPAAMEQYVWPPSPNPAPTSLPVASWNFTCTAPTQLGGDGTAEAVARSCESAVPEIVAFRRKKASRKSSVPASAPYAQDHIIAERNRREKINKRFIELSSVIPGLKKMDKATILSDATRHVKELQEKVKSLEAEGSNGTVVRKASYMTAPEENGSPLSGAPEIEAKFWENSVMVRIQCHNARGVVTRMLTEVEEGLHLSITHTNAIPFTSCSTVITITAKVEDGFTVRTEEIVARLKSALQLPTE